MALMQPRAKTIVVDTFEPALKLKVLGFSKKKQLVKKQYTIAYPAEPKFVEASFAAGYLFAGGTRMPETTRDDHTVAKAHVLNRLAKRFRSSEDAQKWYRGYHIPGFGNKTPSQIVRSGHVEALLRYIDGMDAGVHS